MAVFDDQGLLPKLPLVIQSQPAKERITYNLFSWIFDGLTGPVDFSVGYISASESLAESLQKMLV